MRSRAGLLAVSGAGLLWGTTGVAVRVIQDHSALSAVSIGCYRLAISAVVLTVVLHTAVLRRIRQAWHSNRAALLISGAGLGIYQALYFIGVQDVGVSVSTLISLGLAPIVLTIASAVRDRRAPAMAAVVTVLCAVGGLALVTLSAGGNSDTAPHPVIGVLASIASGVGYAFVTVVNRKLVHDGDVLSLTAATSGIGAVVLLPIALAYGMAVPSSAVANGWLLYIGIFPTVAAYWLFYSGLRSTPTEVAGVLTLLEPLTAALLAAAFLDESLSTAGWIGTGLLLAAIAALYARKAEAEPAPL
ncbi:MAG TPA: EamA family transporter [Jatrophihabitantaceae bacterium]|nr:EamA family transporter [Jatrophihabitantaceae bacterium]